MKTSTVVLSLFVVSSLVLSGCGKSTEEDAIRKADAEFHQSFDNKDLERYMAFFVPRYFNGLAEQESITLDQWKQKFQKKWFDPYKNLHTTYEILSIEKFPTEYLLTERASRTGFDSLGNEVIFSKDTVLTTSWIPMEHTWCIRNLHVIHVPSFYDTLPARYSGIGSAGLLYVSHITQRFVSVIDTRVNKVVGVVHGGYGITSVAFAPRYKLGYIAAFTEGIVTVFNTETNEKLATIPAGVYPSNLLVDPEEYNVYIGHESLDGIYVMSRGPNSIFKKTPGQTGPFVWSFREHKIYQPQIFRPYVEILDPNDLSLERISVGGRPMNLAFTPDEWYAYVSNYDLNEVEKIATATKEVVKRIGGVPHPRGIGIRPDGLFAYVTNVKSKMLTILNLRRDIVVDSLQVGEMPTDIAINPVNNCAYISNQGGGTVSVLDMKTNRIVDTITVADNPISLRLDLGSIPRRPVSARK